jgi:hypothetical protein
MRECTERSEGRDAHAKGRHGMSEGSEGREGHDAHAKGRHGMSECTEGREHMREDGTA